MKASPQLPHLFARNWGYEVMAIPITRPVMGDSEISAIAAVLDSGYLVQGVQVAEFERLVANHVGTNHAEAVSNCTSALRIALLALGTTEIGDAAAFDRTMASIQRERPEFARRINTLATRLLGCMDPAE